MMEEPLSGIVAAASMYEPTAVHYVVGFMFSTSLNQVALIRKQKPAWQAGLLNGIGGKVEKDENCFDTMVREFKEETGREHKDWNRFAETNGRSKGKSGEIGEKFRIDFFHTRGLNLWHLNNPEQPITGEKIEIIYTQDVNPQRVDMIDNLAWLIGLALDNARDGRPDFVNIQYW